MKKEEVYHELNLQTAVKSEVDMNFLNLEYFLIAAEELNFTRAADRIHIAQQSLSNHIAKLEEHFGTPLFDRKPPMTLTPAGLCLVRYAKQLQKSVDELEAEIQDIKDFKSSELTLGITRARGEIYLPMILPKFTRAFPQIRVNLYEDSSARLERALREAKVDLIIGLPPEDPLGITSEIVWEERYVVIVPDRVIEEYIPEKKEKLWHNPEKITLKDFEKCPFLSIKKNLLVGKTFRSCCEDVGMMPNVILESQSINVVLSLCLEGMGALVCPDIFLYPYRDLLHTEKGKGTVVFPVNYSDEIAVSYLREKYFSIGSQKFKELIKEIGRGIAFS